MSTSIASPTNTATASVIIPLADEQQTGVPPAEGDFSTMRLAESFGPTAPPEPQSPSPQPAVVMAPKAVVSPAARHVSRREQNRRKQFSTAILLLVTVIVLAIVLIWIVK